MKKRILFCTVLAQPTVQERTKLQSQRGSCTEAALAGERFYQRSTKEEQNGWKNARVRN